MLQRLQCILATLEKPKHVIDNRKELLLTLLSKKIELLSHYKVFVCKTALMV